MGLQALERLRFVNSLRYVLGGRGFPGFFKGSLSIPGGGSADSWRSLGAASLWAEGASVGQTVGSLLSIRLSTRTPEGLSPLSIREQSSLLWCRVEARGCVILRRRCLLAGRRSVLRRSATERRSFYGSLAGRLRALRTVGHARGRSVLSRPPGVSGRRLNGASAPPARRWPRRCTGPLWRGSVRSPCSVCPLHVRRSFVRASSSVRTLASHQVGERRYLEVRGSQSGRLWCCRCRLCADWCGCWRCGHASIVFEQPSLTGEQVE